MKGISIIIRTHISLRLIVWLYIVLCLRRVACRLKWDTIFQYTRWPEILTEENSQVNSMMTIEKRKGNEWKRESNFDNDDTTTFSEYSNTRKSYQFSKSPTTLKSPLSCQNENTFSFIFGIRCVCSRGHNSWIWEEKQMRMENFFILCRFHSIFFTFSFTFNQILDDFWTFSFQWSEIFEKFNKVIKSFIWIRLNNHTNW